MQVKYICICVPKRSQAQLLGFSLNILCKAHYKKEKKLGEKTKKKKKSYGI